MIPPRAPDDTRPELGARYDTGHGTRHVIGHADLIIDGMLGIGGKGGLRDPYATLAQLAANSGAPTVAVDLPTGIDADTGAVDGPAVRADVTVTFGAVKPGLLIDPGAGHAGVVELVDIGLGPHLLEPPGCVRPAARRHTRSGPASHRGVGQVPPRRARPASRQRPVHRRGPARDRRSGPRRRRDGPARHLPGSRRGRAPRRPEVVITELAGEIPGPDGSRDSPRTWGGCRHGSRAREWASTEVAADRLAAVLRTSLPVLVDADGLTLLARDRSLLPRPAPTLLTPHAGELGRLLGADPADVEARRLEYVRRAATEFGACVLLKGSTTVVAPPDGLDPVLVNTTGTPWLATAGTGDVLSGLAGALLAQGLLPPQAAITAAYLHGLAARLAAADLAGTVTGAPVGAMAGPDEEGADARGTSPIGASDVVRALPMAFRALY